MDGVRFRIQISVGFRVMCVCMSWHVYVYLRVRGVPGNVSPVDQSADASADGARTRTEHGDLLRHLFHQFVVPRGWKRVMG